jgi:membrane protein implicated in regulation of membrane protease activity
MKPESDLHAIASLLGDALAQASRLFQREVDLAKTELSEKAARAAAGAALFLGAALLVIPAITLLLFALAASLVSQGWTQATAYLAAGILAAVFGAILAMIGAYRLSPRDLTPSETLTQLGRDKDVVKGLTQ